MAELEAESSDSKDEQIATAFSRLFGSEENVGQSHDENQSADSADADEPQPTRSKDGLLWMLATTSQYVQGCLQQQNIINLRSDLTSNAAHHIHQNSVVSFFKILFNQPMLRHIRKKHDD